MKPTFEPDSIGAILLDIEGTTTPVDFVYKILFPYARLRMADYLTEHFFDAEVQTAIAQLHLEQATDEDNHLNPPPLSTDLQPTQIASLVAYLHWLMDADRKSKPLKTLQGRIWEAGYRDGELRGEVFADVPQAFARWHSQGKAICIYSSGSVLAQKLIFAHTTFGDLTAYLSAYFDTQVGGKKEPESYQRIVEALGYSPPTILFISDVIGELDAARAANLQTLCSVRPGNQPLTTNTQHTIINTFDEVL